MLTEWLSESELELLRWYRTLSNLEIAAIVLWLDSGDMTQVYRAFSHHLIAAA